MKREVTVRKRRVIFKERKNKEREGRERERQTNRHRETRGVEKREERFLRGERKGIFLV